MHERLDVAVVHSPVGGGHKAAALAVAEAARARGLSVEVLDTFEHAPRVFGHAYLAAHLTAQGVLPGVYGAAFFSANRRDRPLEPVRRGIDHLAWAGLVERVLAMRPRAVVATHHIPLLVLGRARRSGLLDGPLVGVVTDYGTHAVWAEKGVDALCVPCAGARHDAIFHGFAPQRIHVTGIPVRSAFEAVPELRAPARGEALRVLVTSGGFGVGPVRAIVRSFAAVCGVEVTVVCGRAAGLAEQVARDAGRAGVCARVLGFERDMAARMAEAHVVVGKAGGLTVTEAMTAGRPMIIAGPVAGNEEINAALVQRAGAGVATGAGSVGAVVEGLRARGLLVGMGRAARGLVPTHAAERVVGVAAALGGLRAALDAA
jgi:processive 1,2-diacylglycerol beta-glucosyltransferase